MRPFEKADAALPGIRRGRVLAGEGMVTPRRRLVLKENGRTEELIPGVHRFARDYPLVRESPELFEPADSEDAETFRHHRQLAERKLRRLGGTTTRADTRPHRKFRLGAGRPRDRWRLP